LASDIHHIENVGGEILDAVLRRLNAFARIPLCGLVSQYNLTEPYGEIRNRRKYGSSSASSGHPLPHARGFLPIIDTTELIRVYFSKSYPNEPI
jgi:hypothetical protein